MFYEVTPTYAMPNLLWRWLKMSVNICTISIVSSEYVVYLTYFIHRIQFDLLYGVWCDDLI